MDTKRTFNNSTAETRPVFPSYAEIRHQRLRGEATAQMLMQAGRGAARLTRAARAALARWQEQRRTRHALMSCSDRVLADIGIQRADIPLIAKGTDLAEYEWREPALRRWWAAARDRVHAARTARTERRRLSRELDAYTDRELDEIGLRRADVRGIARGQSVLRRAA